jgi:hypothetical protein
MNNNKKRITESTILDEIRRGRISLPPLSFRLIERESDIGGKYRIDALIEGSWNDSSAIFAAEIKSLSTPKAFSEGLAVLKAVNLPKNRLPLLITPFLSEKQLQELELEDINGMDLCGNGVFNIAGKLRVYRNTGKKNPFPSYAPIKNIYRKNSSMVGRTFLVNPDFVSVTLVVQKIRDLDIFSPAMSQPAQAFGTVSKVLSGMEQDLIIERTKSKISLLQSDTLLEKLSQNYSGPAGPIKVPVKVNLDGNALLKRLSELSGKIMVPIVATGLSSVSRYAIMQREEKLSVYCPRGEELLSLLAPTASSRFPNLEIIDTMDATAYFDAREEQGFMWASPVQTYLELMRGDKRDQEVAGQIKSFLLDQIGKARE